MPKITVLMSEYNTRTEYLKNTIESVLNQTFKDYEFIIVDDCGNNDLAKIVAGFDDDRIKIVKNPRNMGFVYSLNNGIKHAKGKYIVSIGNVSKNGITKLLGRGVITNNPKDGALLL